MQVNAELGVDEPPAAEIEFTRDAAGAVGHDEHPLQWGCLLIRHERIPQPGPYRCRPGQRDTAADLAPLDCGNIPVYPARGHHSGSRAGWLARQPGRGALPGHRLAAGPQDAPRPGAGHVPAVSTSHCLEQFDAATGPDRAGCHLELADRDGAEDLTREPGNDHVIPRRAVLNRPAHQGTRRTTVLGTRIPRAARVHRRAPPAVA